MTSSGAPDYWLSTGGRASPASLKERRSTIKNDDGVVDGISPPSSREDVDYHGKFFPRGCRGVMESLSIYCIRTGSGTLTLRYAPYPGLGPVGSVTITPGSTWAWKSAAVEKMWNYDSLFIWVSAISSDVSWAYDAVSPVDGHSSDDSGATWEDVTERPFIRAVYTGETPGDVPVSGIINNIPIPYASSEAEVDFGEVLKDVETTMVDVHGAGYCDYIEMTTGGLNNTHRTQILVYCDEVFAGSWAYSDLSGLGHSTSTPTVSLTAYGVDGDCAMLIHKRFEFRRRFRVAVLNELATMLVTVRAYPTRMR